MWIAFFFLLRAGEYLLSGPEAHPFLFQDIRLWCGTTPIDPLTASAATIQTATFAALVFTKQKNAVLGEIVGHGPSYHVRACPVGAIVRRVLHLRSVSAPSLTPICSVGPQHRPLKPQSLLALLDQARNLYNQSSNSIIPKIQLHALRATGATALLSCGASSDTIKLLGRWRSEASLRYLHLQNHSRISVFAQSMLNGTPIQAS
jgi:hypothetical protein